MVIIGEVNVFLLAMVVSCDGHCQQEYPGFESTRPDDGHDKRHARLAPAHSIGDLQKTFILEITHGRHNASGRRDGDGERK